MFVLSLSSLIIDCSHVTSAVALAMLLYSASVLDLEMVDCFLELHDIKLSPTNMQYHVTDFLSSGSVPQSEST